MGAGGGHVKGHGELPQRLLVQWGRGRQRTQLPRLLHAEGRGELLEAVRAQQLGHGREARACERDGRHVGAPGLQDDELVGQQRVEAVDGRELLREAVAREGALLAAENAAEQGVLDLGRARLGGLVLEDLGRKLGDEAVPAAARGCR